MTDTLPKILIIKKENFLKNYKILLPLSLKKKIVIESLKLLRVNFSFMKKQTIYNIKNAIYIGELHQSGNPRPELIKELSKSLNPLKKNATRKLYISRKNSNRRKLINEKHLLKYLKTLN